MTDPFDDNRASRGPMPFPSAFPPSIPAIKAMIPGAEAFRASRSPARKNLFYLNTYSARRIEKTNGVLVRRPPGLYSYGSRVRLPGTSPILYHHLLEESR